MHRHGYKGRKFSRERDARRVLLKTLASNLIEHESMETTLPKAKELRPYVEKLVTKAKQGTLHARRQVIAGLANEEVAHKLVDELAPLLGSRTSGYLRIEKLGLRQGDGAPLARVEFVDDFSELRKSVKSVKKADDKKPEAKKPAAKKPVADKKASAAKTKEAK